MVVMKAGSEYWVGVAMCARAVRREIPSELFTSHSQCSNLSWCSGSGTQLQINQTIREETVNIWLLLISICKRGAKIDAIRTFAYLTGKVCVPLRAWMQDCVSSAELKASSPSVSRHCITYRIFHNMGLDRVPYGISDINNQMPNLC